MKKLLSLGVLLVLLITVKYSYAAQDPLYTQYMFNRMLVNPAYAGTPDVWSILSSYRHQWSGFDGAPRTFSLSSHGPVSALEGVSVGGSLVNYKVGPEHKLNFSGVFAYKLKLTEQVNLSLALQGDLMYYDIDFSKIAVQNLNDVYVYNSQFYNKVAPDFGVGAYCYSDKWFAGVSVGHLLQKQFGFVQSGNTKTLTRMARNVYAIAGYDFAINDEFVLRPSTLVRYNKTDKLNADFNLNCYVKNIFWIGTSYRTEKALAFLAGVNIANKFQVGYSYDTVLNPKVRNVQRSTHEFVLGFIMPKHQARLKNPRFLY